MTDLSEAAARVGISTSYHDAFGQQVSVPDETLRLLIEKLSLPDESYRVVDPCIILAEGQEVQIALATDESVFWQLVQEDGQELSGTTEPGARSIAPRLHLAAGYHHLTVKLGDNSFEARVIVTPERAYIPWTPDNPDRVWGVAAQLYGLRSGTNWGIGDFTDLANLVSGVGRMGASVVGVNPLHAIFPDDAERASPYSPSSRQFLNWLYLDVTAILEYRESAAVQELVASHEFQHELARLRATTLVDYSGVATAKRRVIDLVYVQFREAHLGKGDGRDRAFNAFRTAQGAPLRRFGLFHALREVLGATDWSMRDWRNWGPEYRHPESPGVAAFAEQSADRVEFYEYIQFLLFEQLGRVKEAAQRVSMKIGLYGDLAVGVDVAGAEGWGSQDLIAPGLSIGAPPDPLAPHGQNWGLPVFNPEAMRRLGYEPFIRVLRSVMQNFGALRIDHVLGLWRLYCIPQEDPYHGSYLKYPFEDLVRIVALESQRNKCLIIGEDLGTLPEGFREALMARGILSYRVLWFEQSPDTFLPPEAYPSQALVTISTHDLPTMAGFWYLSDISLRRQLNLMNEDQTRALYEERTSAKGKLTIAMRLAGLLPQAEALPETLPAAEIHRFVARTNSALMLVQLEDILSDRSQANMPGTMDEHPNWRRKLPIDLPALLGEQSMRQLAEIAGEEKRTSGPVNLPRRNTVDEKLAIPASTYRLQFSAAFTFKDAIAIIPYLAELGVSHVYASSYLSARSGSTHGYDVIDHNAINPEIGNETDFKDYLRTLNSWRMGQILDFVPNHMGVGRADNEWWLDLLEWGQESPYGRYFDIDWQIADPGLRGKVMLPVLGEAFGDAVTGGTLKLGFEPQLGTFSMWYGEHRFPIRIADYAAIIRRSDEPELSHFVESFDLLFKSGTKRATRRSAAAALKAQLSQAASSEPRYGEALSKAAASYVGTAGDKPSWSPYVELIERQNYRLASWRLAADEINYRRFFDINDLAGIRVEDEELFELMHRMLGRLVAQGALHGVRIDHIDGLYDPLHYLIRLYRYLGRFGAPGDPKAKGRDRFYVLVEKILGMDEELRGTWPVAGTTGYEFVADTTALFVDSGNQGVFDEAYQRFTGMTESFEEIHLQAKHFVITQMLASDLARLARRLKNIADRDWSTRDFSLNRLRTALIEIVKGYRVYRTYVTGRLTSAEDRARIGEALSSARAHWISPDSEILTFVERVLTGDVTREPQSLFKKPDVFAFIQAFQQFTGPVMAKSLEDTTFYRYYRLISLNEVGNDPRRFGIDIPAFHAANARRAKAWPNSMLGSSTHDTKRGEDTRARISVLSELGDEWPHIVERLANAASALKPAEGPTANDEYMIYQTLLGVWPDDGDGWEGLRERLKQYVTKAMREAKVHTTWTHPVEAYETATLAFIDALLDSQAFLAVAAPVAAKVVKFGYINSLSQTLIKLTAPGVPDIYQGSDLWNFSLADPDNRLPVDYEARQRLLAETPRLSRLLEETTGPAQLRDGGVKLRLVQRLLILRRQEQGLFETGSYEPVQVSGKGANHIIAYVRTGGGRKLFVAAGRLMTRIEAQGAQPDSYAWDWGDTTIEVPEAGWSDLLNRRMPPQGSALSPDRIFGALPLAVWITES